MQLYVVSSNLFCGTWRTAPRLTWLFAVPTADTGRQVGSQAQREAEKAGEQAADGIDRAGAQAKKTAGDLARQGREAGGEAAQQARQVGDTAADEVGAGNTPLFM